MVTRDQNHIYRNEDGEIYLSVTQHLQIAGMVDFSMVRREDLEYAAKRGQFVHEAVNMYLHDDLELEGLDEQYRGYVEGFIKFAKDNSLRVWTSEEIVYDDTQKTAGTYDFVGTLGSNCRLYSCLFEIKTPATLPKTSALQTAGYKLMANKNKKYVYDRATILLKPNGKYRLEVHKDNMDEKIFRSIVHLNWWALNQGIIPVGARNDEKVYNLCKLITKGN